MVFHWNVEPEIFNIGNFALRYYSVCFGTGIFLCYFFMEKIFRKELRPAEDLDNLLMYVFIAIVVGARLGHCLFYGDEDGLGYNPYFKNPIDILKVWEGGLSSHGALFGIVLSLYLFVRKYPQYSYLWVIDRVCVVAGIACAMIRIGNFFNSEIVGYYTDGSWGIIFDQLNETKPRIPIMLFESASYLLFFIFAITYYFRKNGKLVSGRITAVFFVVMLSIRFVWEFFKDSPIKDSGLTQGQNLSIPIIIAGIVLFLYTYRKNAA